MNNLFVSKRIGSTIYQVKVFFCENATETMEDKLLRIIQNQPLANGEKCDILSTSQMSRSA